MRRVYFLRAAMFLSLTALLFSCDDNNEETLPTDKRSFITDAGFDFFINRNGTIDITVTGSYTEDTNYGDISQRGFVYGSASQPAVGDVNTGTALGPNPVYATFRELPFGETFYVRGYFKMSDGTYFYGNEIKVSTDVDASDSRSISMAIKPELFFKNSEGITPELEVTAIEKESPVEIGFEYSVNQDFSNSSITLDTDLYGNVFVTVYSEFIEDLKPKTLYYFRPYAKYADGTITNGGTSKASFTTL